MSELQAALRTAFEENGYEVGEVSKNRNVLRVVILEESAEAADLELITTDTIDEDDLLGVNVTTEAIDGQDQMGTVVSIRQRS